MDRILRLPGNKRLNLLELIHRHLNRLFKLGIAPGDPVFRGNLDFKVREWLASELAKAHNGNGKKFQDKIDILLANGLISEKDAAEILKGPKDPAKPTIGPTLASLYINAKVSAAEKLFSLITSTLTAGPGFTGTGMSSPSRNV